MYNHTWAYLHICYVLLLMNVGDTLRTVAVFAAAFVSSVTGIDGDICDAWAAIVSGKFHDTFVRTYVYK